MAVWYSAYAILLVISQYRTKIVACHRHIYIRTHTQQNDIYYQILAKLLYFHCRRWHGTRATGMLHRSTNIIYFSKFLKAFSRIPYNRNWIKLYYYDLHTSTKVIEFASCQLIIRLFCSCFSILYKIYTTVLKTHDYNISRVMY